MCIFKELMANLHPVNQRLLTLVNTGMEMCGKINDENQSDYDVFNLEDLQNFVFKEYNELGLTQKDLANAVDVNLRTLQDWELGRSPTPRPVEILMNLMKKFPAVRKELLAESLKK